MEGLKSSCTRCTFVGGETGRAVVAGGGMFGEIGLSDLTFSGAGIWLDTILLIWASVSTSFASAWSPNGLVMESFVFILLPEPGRCSCCFSEMMGPRLRRGMGTLRTLLVREKRDEDAELWELRVVVGERPPIFSLAISLWESLSLERLRRTKKKMRPAMMARARMTPMAMPALAPPDVPSVACATGDAVAEGEDDAVLETAAMAVAGMTEEIRVVDWRRAADVGTAAEVGSALLGRTLVLGVSNALDASDVLGTGRCWREG